jgi:hypothetical protein
VAGFEGAEVGAEGEGRVPFGDPRREAVGENGDDFATDGADAMGGIGEEGGG